MDSSRDRGGSSADPDKEKYSKSSRNDSRERNESRHENRDRSRSRNRDKERSSKRDRDRSRSRSHSVDRGRKRHRSVSRSRSKSRSNSRDYSSSRSRSRSLSSSRSRSRSRSRGSSHKSKRKSSHKKRKSSHNKHHSKKGKHKKSKHHRRSSSSSSYSSDSSSSGYDSYSSSSSDSDYRRKKRRKEKKRKMKKLKKKEKHDKKPKKLEYGAYGIIHESDMYTKEAEFRCWLIEVKDISVESLPPSGMKQYFAEYMEENHSSKIQSPTKNSSFISSYDYMKEQDNKPKYPVSFERRQEIYGYSGQKYMTRNTIFTEYKHSKSLINDSIINEENNDTNNNNELETFVCASDEGSCSSIIWKCHWDNKYSLAHHSLYQELPSENKSVILDIKHCPLTNTHNNILACLTGDQVFFYRR
ncbi:hypothetical protein PIROE2DRAFT_2676 [Piromyces sp. E2]|nr:hypothetical protein PIROE2DRAFT_2676 [Piromyces sp. E2]|eukprot:OUM69379.1 hypothetical protein PIROE2DRAFT_2676 [Piromyces sp. E2]